MKYCTSWSQLRGGDNFYDQIYNTIKKIFTTLLLANVAHRKPGSEMPELRPMPVCPTRAAGSQSLSTVEYDLQSPRGSPRHKHLPHTVLLSKQTEVLVHLPIPFSQSFSLPSDHKPVTTFIRHWPLHWVCNSGGFHISHWLAQRDGDTFLMWWFKWKL